MMGREGDKIREGVTRQARQDQGQKWDRGMSGRKSGGGIMCFRQNK